LIEKQKIKLKQQQTETNNFIGMQDASRTAKEPPSMKTTTATTRSATSGTKTRDASRTAKTGKPGTEPKARDPQ
jgi:hypothetical protein